jgi:hypothetical protein
MQYFAKIDPSKMQYSAIMGLFKCNIPQNVYMSILIQNIYYYYICCDISRRGNYHGIKGNRKKVLGEE